MTWAWDNREVVLDLFWQHTWLSLVPIALGFVLAVPIGWYATRHPRLRGVLLSAGSVLYTIPSLALFVVLPGLIGTGFLSPLNVIVALTLYAVAIMVRTAADAFASVSPAVLDAASATLGDAVAVATEVLGPTHLATLVTEAKAARIALARTGGIGHGHTGRVDIAPVRFKHDTAHIIKLCQRMQFQRTFMADFVKAKPV